MCPWLGLVCDFGRGLVSLVWVGLSLVWVGLSLVGVGLSLVGVAFFMYFSSITVMVHYMHLPTGDSPRK